MQQHYCQKNTGVMKTPTKFKPKWEKKKIVINASSLDTQIWASLPLMATWSTCGIIHQSSSEIFKEEAAEMGNGSFKQPGSWINWKLNVSVVTPLIASCGNSSLASITWPWLKPPGYRDYQKHVCRHLSGWLHCPDCCCWRWWIWSKKLQEWADQWVSTPFWLTHWAWNH